MAITSVSTKRGTGRNSGRTCVVAKTDTKGKKHRGKHGVTLKDSGKRFYGCYGSAAAAQAAVKRIESGKHRKKAKRKSGKRKK